MKRQRPRGQGWSVAGRAAIVATVILAVALGSATRARNRLYADDERLWADTVAKQPANERARVAYGSILASRGKVDDAAAQFRAAVEISDTDPVAHARLGSALAAQGRTDEAAAHLERALALRPGDVEAHRSLGFIYASRNEDAKALPHLVQAADATGDPALVTRVAAVLAGSPDPAVRDPRRAIAYAERAVTLTSRRDPLSLDILAASLAAAGRLDEAAAAAREGLPLARALGNAALAAELEQRARAYAR